MAIAALAAFALTGLGDVAGPAVARECGALCADTAQYRPGPDGPAERRFGPSGHGRERYGSRPGEHPRSGPQTRGGREPLSDQQIWSIARSRVPGRIIRVRLHGSVYSFRIISRRGNIVDVVIDRYSGRIVSVSGGP